MGAIGRVSLEAIAGKTHMTVRIECGSAARLQQYLEMHVHVGTANNLDNLVAFLDTTPRSQTCNNH